MAFYDLQCNLCGSRFSVQASMDDRANRRIPCPSYGGTDLSRDYANANIAVTGSAAPAPKPGCCHCKHAEECQRMKR